MKKKDNLVILLGPTAIGKTSTSIELAKSLNGEIISSDSMQIYKYMDIGSAKILNKEKKGIPHYIVDLIDIDEEFSVSDYKIKAEKYIKDINKRDKVPIVTGGTGLYINSLVYDLNFTEVAANENFRRKMEDFVKENGNKALHKKLEIIDVKSAERIHPNDIKRVIRALEIYNETGNTMTYYNKNFRTPVSRYNLAMIGLNMDREALYNRINKRVDNMIDKGLIEEVKSIINMGYDPDLVALQGIGYKEIIMYLEDEISLEESINLIKQKSRNYAKRQLTWFRRDNRIKWFNRDEFNTETELNKAILNYIKTKIM